MPEPNNVDVVRRVLNALFAVAGRRTLDSYAIMVINTVIKKLELDYDFLKGVELQESAHLEGKEVAITIPSSINKVDSAKVGDAIDTLIRVVYLDLKDDAGVYFISEVKERLGEEHAEDIRKLGVDLDQIQAEQHELFNLQERKPVPPDTQPEKPKPEIELGYTWDTVSTWKYENNVCMLYDGGGKLLDTIQLDMLIEDYVRRVTEFKEPTLDAAATMTELTEKECDFLQLLHDRDIDADSALFSLHISGQKFDVMIQKLLQMELLQHISENEIKITEKGIEYLTKKETK